MSFELDISKYTSDDLRNIFNLNINYTLQDIQRNKNILKNKLLVNNTLSSDKSNKIIEFLNNAQTILTNQVLDLKKIPDSEQRNYQLLCIDTKYRKNYYNTKSTNFLYDLPFNLKDVLAITLYETSIPFSIWTINEKYKNNYFWIEIDNSWNFIRLQSGNYNTPDDIKQQINNAIQLTFQDNYDNSGVYFDINKYTKQSVFGSINDADVSFNIHFNREPMDLSNFNFDNSFNYITGDAPPILNRNLMMGLGWILGFRYGEYSNFESDGDGNIIISEGVYDIWNPKNIFLIVDDFANNSNNCVISTFADSIGSSNILARLQTNFNSNTELTISNANIINFSKRTYNGPIDIKKIQIKIVDEFGREIDLNNMDYSIGILVETLGK